MKRLFLLALLLLSAPFAHAETEVAVSIITAGVGDHYLSINDCSTEVEALVGNNAQLLSGTPDHDLAYYRTLTDPGNLGFTKDSNDCNTVYAIGTYAGGILLASSTAAAVYSPPLADGTYNWTFRDPDTGEYLGVYFAFNVSGGIPIPSPVEERTRIITVLPALGDIIATSSPDTTVPIGGTGFISDSDFYAKSTKPVFNVKLKKANFLSSFASIFSTQFTRDERTWEIQFPGSFEFATTSVADWAPGLYTLDAAIKQPSFSLFGFNLTYTTLVASTTNFVIGAPTARDLLWLKNQQDANDFENTASSTASGAACLTFRISECVQYLFLPGGNAGDGINGTFDAIKRKPPFGYFPLIADAFSTTTVASTSPLAYVAGAPVIAGMFSVLIGGIANILFLMLALFMFKRLSRFDFHL